MDPVLVCSCPETTAASFPAECSPGWYGRNCERPCACRNGGLCDAATGTCHCPAGYIGADCSVGECPGQTGGQELPGVSSAGGQRWQMQFWGDQGSCVCLLPGCPAGHYGQDCARVCSCGEGATCHPVTGDCVCPPGRTGATCEQGQYQRWGSRCFRQLEEASELEKVLRGNQFPCPETSACA